MLDPKLEERKTQFHKNYTNLLRTREGHKLTLRKEKIDEFILRKREKILEKSEDTSILEINLDELVLPSEVVNMTCESLKEFLEVVINFLNSKDLNYVKLGILVIRRHLSIKNHPTFIELINHQIPSELLNCLDMYSYDDSIVYEILWCFTNISACVDAPEMSNFFLTPKAYKLYDKIISSHKPELIHNLLWLCCNIVTDSETARDAIINSSFFGKVLDLLEESDVDSSVIKNGIWLLANLTKTKPKNITNDILERSVKIVCKQIQCSDADIITDCIWSLAGLLDTNNHIALKYVVDSGIVPIILSLENFHQKHMLEPPLRIVGNLLTGDEMITDQLISFGCIPFLIKHLHSPYKAILREAAWGLSNIAAGSTGQIKQIINSNAIPKLCELAKYKDIDVAKEAIWTISNCISGGDLETCIDMVNLNIIDVIIYVLGNILEPNVLGVTLEGLKSLFKHGEEIKNFNSGSNPMIETFNSFGGAELLEKLQNHSNIDIDQMITKILEIFYEVKTDKKS